MSGRAWFRSVIAWDGCFPLLVSSSPMLLPAVLPQRDLTELTAVIGVPIVAALLRAHHGCRQLERRVGVRATLGRQFLFGCAIAMLLLFEGYSGMLHCAPGCPAVGLVHGQVELSRVSRSCGAGPASWAFDRRLTRCNSSLGPPLSRSMSRRRTTTGCPRSSQPIGRVWELLVRDVPTCGGFW